MVEHINDGNYNLVFNADGTANEVDKSGYVKRAGVHTIVYSQKEIVDKISAAVESNNLNKGLYLDYGYSYKFTFDYKYIDSSNNVHNPHIRISIEKELLNESTCSMNYSKLSQICDEIIRVKKINRAKIEREKRKLKLKRKQKFVLVLATSASLLLGAAGISYGVSKSQDYERKMHEREIDKINKQRIANGIPPLGLVDESGRQYDTWKDYYDDLYKSDSKIESNEEKLQSAYTFLKDNQNDVLENNQTDTSYRVVPESDIESFHL